MTDNDTRPILYEIECPECHGEFTKRFDPERPLTEDQIKNSERVKQTQKCPYCSEEISYELPAIIIPKEPVERFRG
jgi:hypothetical protein